MSSPASLDRRRFLSTAGFAVAVSGLHANSAGAIQAAPANAGCAPAGELASRIRLAADRMTQGQAPAFTDEFILADVALAPERRFNEFSGDLSGRFIEAFAVRPFGSEPGRLARLVRAVLSHQRSDGRFGKAELAFTPESIGPAHMALLWGNGRMLVGLTEAHRRLQSPEILQSARRLAGFLLQVRRDCSEPAVLERLEGLGANGSICFTQTVEGLVELSRLTGDRSYLEAASSILPLLGPRGIQHSHGYLTTLRGAVKLYEEKRDPEDLAFVERAYRDLVRSTDYTVYGSVTEYFGWNSASKRTADLSTLIANSGGDPRDEGCSHADFVRLSLQLWRATGEAAYLDRAERCLWNGLYPNQYPTGDFGSHAYFAQGMKPVANLGRAWWCCTMHGYRALKDVLDAAVTIQNDRITVNLLEEVEGSDRESTLRTKWGPATQDGFSFKLAYLVRWMRAPKRQMMLALRKPEWAENAALLVNGTKSRCRNVTVTGRSRGAGRPATSSSYNSRSNLAC